MTALTIRIESVERFAHDGSVDTLPLKAGVNVLVGLKDTGKTAWLNTISFLLGDTGTPEEALGAGLAAKFDSARLRLVIGGNVPVLLERRWKESGSKHRIFVNGDGVASSDFSAWIQKALGIPSLRFPKGNPYSGATWPELSWRMLFRHVYREERFWADLADRQPEKEQHACLLQFFGVASKVYSQELGDEIRQRQNLLALRARRDQFDEVLQQTARSLLADANPQEVLTKESLTAGVNRLRVEINACQVERNKLLELVTGGPSEIHFQRRSGDPVIHLAAGWLGRAAEKSARAAKYG